MDFGLVPNRKISLFSSLKDFDFRIFHRPFSKKRRVIIFILLCFINIIINLDHGAIPAATKILKIQLDIDNFELGILGSLIYLGLVLGGMTASVLFGLYSAKWLISFSLIMSGFFLYMFTLTKNIWLLSLARIGCGFFQVFGVIYFPVWVDEYGVKDLRTYWMSCLQLGAPLGTMIGYLLQALFIDESIDINSWKKAYYIQIILVFVSVFLLIITPDKFFSKNYKRSEKPHQEFVDEVVQNKQKLEILYNNGKTNQGVLNRHKRNLEKFGRFSQYSVFSVLDYNDLTDSQSYSEMILELINKKIYLYILLCISSLLFVVTGIQFWISDYMLTILKISREKVFISFSIVCLTGPVSGVFYGGYIINQIGGYTNPNAIQICFSNSIKAAFFGVLLPFIWYFPLFIIDVWFLLFFGASIVPGLTGIMLNSLGDIQKEVANSLTQIFYNLIGYLPSPFMYGLICHLTGGSQSPWGLMFLMFFCIAGVFFLYLAKNVKDKPEEIQIFESSELIKVNEINE